VPIPGTNATHVSGNPQNGVLVLSDNLVSAAGGTAGQAASSAAVGVPIRTAAIPFTLHEDGLVTSHVTTKATVADALLDAGVTAVVQPGGSVRDEEVIAAAVEAGVAMYFTGERHFFH